MRGDPRGSRVARVVAVRAKGVIMMPATLVWPAM
jgi:hypothetical protein